MTGNCPKCGTRWTGNVTAITLDDRVTKLFTCPECGNTATQKTREKAKPPELDSLILDRQRQRISTLVNEGKLLEAHAALNVVSELWFKYKLGYAYTELHKKIQELLKHL